MNITHNL